MQQCLSYLLSTKMMTMVHFLMMPCFLCMNSIYIIINWDHAKMVLGRFWCSVLCGRDHLMVVVIVGIAVATNEVTPSLGGVLSMIQSTGIVLNVSRKFTIC